MEALADAALGRWFTDRFSASRPDVAASFREMIATTRVAGYVGCAAALRDADLTTGVGTITAPTLVVNGLRDAATPPALGRWLVERIASSRLVELDAAHLSNVEQADLFNDAVIRFLTE
jgi:3-oxoadipate enol-lactonase